MTTPSRHHDLASWAPVSALESFVIYFLWSSPTLIILLISCLVHPCRRVGYACTLSCVRSF
ncbi:hypothetical protein BDR03DRAFT_947850 [Suillus americanus]|nr:hypothetical protein BDR03DRAFT_947850 [Suillus americanus]